MASPTKVTATKVTVTKVIPPEEKVSSNGIKYKVGNVPYVILALCVTSFAFGLAAYLLDEEEHIGFAMIGTILSWFAALFGVFASYKSDNKSAFTNVFIMHFYTLHATMCIFGAILALTMAIVDFVLVVPEVERVVLAMNILANIALIALAVASIYSLAQNCPCCKPTVAPVGVMYATNTKTTTNANKVAPVAVTAAVVATDTKKQPQAAATKSSVTWEDFGKKAVKTTVIKVLPNTDQSDAIGGDDLKSRAKAAVESADGDGLISTLRESDVPTTVQQNV